MRLETALSPLSLLLVIVLMTAAGLLVRRFYRQTLPQVGSSPRRILILLRIVSLILISLFLVRPVWLIDRTVEYRGRLLVVLEDSGSMQKTDTPGGLSRWDAGLEIGRIIQAINAEVDAPVDVTFMRGNGLLDPVITDPRNTLLPASAVGTDLNALLNSAVGLADNQSIRGMVLVTDGNESPGTGAFTLTPGLQHLPGLVVGTGSGDEFFDISIRDTHYPGSAFMGDEVIVEVTAEIRGQPPIEILARLDRGDIPVSEQRVVLQPDQTIARFEMSYRPASEGLDFLTLSLIGPDNETLQENNRASLAVDVLHENAKLLYLCGTPDWNTRTLAQAAGGEPRVDLQIIEVLEPGTSFAGAGQDMVPADVDGWLAFDGVLIDIAAAGRLEAGVAALTAAVAEGLGVVFIGGNVHERFPQALEPLLPGARPTLYAGETRLVQGRDARGHVVTARQSGLADAGDLRTPPMATVHWLAPAPDSDILLEACLPGDAATCFPVMVAGAYGEGRVLWSGLPDLWKIVFWQNLHGDQQTEDYTLTALLRNMLVWTSFGDRHAGVFFSDSKRVYAEGETIELAARRQDIRGLTVDQQLVIEIRSSADDGQLLAVRMNMHADPSRPGLMKAVLPPLPPGRYDIRPLTSEEPDGAAAVLELYVVQSTLEGSQIRQDRLNLRSLAAAHGFDYVDQGSPEHQDRLRQFLASLDRSPVEVSRLTVGDLLSGWPLLGLIVLLLGLEWFYRRRLGMI
jgi:hypothetical protein